MQWVEGATFRVGSEAIEGSNEEGPPFETRVTSFCLDRTEVTLQAYAKCVEEEQCEPARADRRFCNQRKPDERANHPVNCITWHEAKAYCEFRGVRLPTEVEWEFAARGGTEYRKYSWGNEHPDGKTCWKHPGGSCEVGKYAVGAFGLHDMTGNVWEWTSSTFGPYPWPPVADGAKVYRGGSWSRRFEKWMRPRLRNRYGADKWGSHLGMRCASTPKTVTCAYGRDEAGGCRHGVESMQCPGNERFNGSRCARPGAAECRTGKKLVPGHGCVPDLDGVELSGDGKSAEKPPVSRTRSTQFDEDCGQHYPGRPKAYRYVGGTHAKRNHVSAQAGCKNRDVGVGWNSTCCP